MSLHVNMQPVRTRNLAEWSSAVCATFGGLQVAVRDAQHFQGQIETRVIGDVRIAKVRSSAATVWHEGALDSQLGSSRYLVKAQMRGASTVTLREGQVEMRPGDLIVCDNSRHYALDFEEDVEILSIPIPEEILGRFHAAPSDLAFRRADATPAVASLVYNYLLGLWGACAAPLPAGDGALFRDMFFELLVRSFSEERPGAARLSTVLAGHLRRCKRYIEENLTDEDLRSEKIAAALAISKRYLHEIFSASGASLLAYVVSRRLDLAARMMRSRQCQGMTIAEVAYACGFKSSAHFARAFKARYGTTASTYRGRPLRICPIEA